MCAYRGTCSIPVNTIILYWVRFPSISLFCIGFDSLQYYFLVLDSILRQYHCFVWVRFPSISSFCLFFFLTSSVLFCSRGRCCFVIILPTPMISCKALYVVFCKFHESRRRLTTSGEQLIISRHFLLPSITSIACYLFLRTSIIYLMQYSFITHMICRPTVS